MNRVAIRGEVHRNDSARILVLITLGFLGLCAAVNLINIAQRVFGVQNGIHACIYFFVFVVRKVQGKSLNGLFSVFKYGEIALKAFRKGIFLIDKRVIGIVTVHENEENQRETSINTK